MLWGWRGWRKRQVGAGAELERERGATDHTRTAWHSVFWKEEERHAGGGGAELRAERHGGGG